MSMTEDIPSVFVRIWQLNLNLNKNRKINPMKYKRKDFRNAIESKVNVVLSVKSG